MEVHAQVAPGLHDAVAVQLAWYLLLVGWAAAEGLQPGVADGKDALRVGGWQAAWGGRVHWAVVDGTKAEEVDEKGGWQWSEVLCEGGGQEAGVCG